MKFGVKTSTYLQDVKYRNDDYRKHQIQKMCQQLGNEYYKFIQPNESVYPLYPIKIANTNIEETMELRVHIINDDDMIKLRKLLMKIYEHAIDYNINDEVLLALFYGVMRHMDKI